MRFVRAPWVLIALLLAALLMLVAMRASADREARAWESRAEIAETFAAEQRHRADANMALALQYEQLADSVVEVIRVRVDTLRERVVEVRSAAVPDTCREIVAARDSLIDAYDATAVTWRMAYDAQVEASKRLHNTVDLLTLANDSLSVTLAARPRPRSRLVPALRPAVFAGVCSDGRRCVGAGISLAWRL